MKWASRYLPDLSAAILSITVFLEKRDENIFLGTVGEGGVMQKNIVKILPPPPGPRALEYESDVHVPTGEWKKGRFGVRFCWKNWVIRQSVGVWGLTWGL